MRSLNARRAAVRPLRVRRSTGPDRTSQLSHSNLYYPDAVVLGPSNFDFQTSPAMVYSPYPSDRTQRVTRALDTDTHGRRGGIHPDDVGRPDHTKEDLPAYSLPNPGLPAYTELVSSSSPSMTTSNPLDHHGRNDHQPNV